MNSIAKIVFGCPARCPNCAGGLKRGSCYWWCRVCRKKWRPKALTWLKGSKLSEGQISTLLRGWQKNVSPGAMKHLTGLSYPTVERWYARFRLHLPVDGVSLQGVVEVDEAFFGRKRHFNQKIVMGAIERRSGRIKLGVIPDREQDSLEGFLLRHVRTDSLLHTDCHTGYYDIGWNGYGHQLHNHSRGHFKDTNQIENVWSVAKRQLRRMYGQIKTDRLPEFLQEWEGRRNFPKLFNSPEAYLATCLVPY